MERLFFLILLIITHISACKQTNTSQQIVEEMIENSTIYSAISYNIRYKHKSFFDSDTFKLEAECIAVKDESDSILKSAYYYSTKDVGDVIFLDKHMYHKNKKNNIDKYNESMSYKLANGNIYSELVNSYFINTNLLMKIMNNDSISLDQEIIDDIKCWKISINYPNGEEFSDERRIIWISTQYKYIVKTTFISKYQGNFQYDEWNYSNVSLGQYDKKYISGKLDSLKSKFPVIKIEELKDESSKVDLINTLANNITGKVFGTEETFDLSKHTDKMVLIDFWYMSCQPCIKAIPTLIKLRDEYSKNQLGIYGINSFDQKNRQILSKFIDNMQINYPIVMTDKSVNNEYYIKSYPTLIIIKAGKIIYYEEGYQENLYNKLKNIIEHNMQKK